MIETTALRIIHRIMDDLADRKGIGDEWSALDEEIGQEIKAAWIKIVMEEIQP